jgi:hypothetical protein
MRERKFGLKVKKLSVESEEEMKEKYLFSVSLNSKSPSPKPKLRGISSLSSIEHASPKET